MLNYTAEQMNIIKSDSTVKNFRVHFPNGELSDLTNDNIVFESVKFKESVCSESIFRFGCLEASVIEFETVGVPNIIGATIECSMEFKNGEQTVIVPYGKFIVDTCPRNHEDMTHRRVTALSRTSDTNDSILPQVEKDKMRILLTSPNSYKPNVWYLLDSISGTPSHTYEDSQFCSLDDAHPSTVVGTPSLAIGHDGDLNIILEADITLQLSSSIEDALYSMSGTYVPDYQNAINSVFEDFDIQGVNEGNVSIFRNYGAFGIMHGGNTNTNPFYYIGLENMDYFYPYFGDVSTGSFRFPRSITLRVYTYNRTTGTQVLYKNLGTFTPYTALTVTKHVATDVPIQLYLNVKHTLEVKRYGTQYYMFSNAYDASKVIQGVAEVLGRFVRTDRDGTTKMITLDDSAPYQLTGADVEGRAWWDEYDVNPIGEVKYVFSDDRGDHEGSYTINGNGLSVYDMTDNYFLDKLDTTIAKAASVAKMTDSRKLYRYGGKIYAYNGTTFVAIWDYSGTNSIIEYILAKFFAPRAEGIHFTPIDMDIAGKPFLQAGDAIRLTANDGTVINSYILKHVFSGIQHITENIETVQGEVIE